MRRLLAALVTSALFLGLASPALASGRVPAGVSRISVVLTFPPQVGGTHRAIHRTLTGTAAVREIVGAANALRPAPVHGVCPMFVRLGPELTVVFRSDTGRMLAETRVQVTLGRRGTSGSSYCFPILFSGAGRNQRLVGNGYVRLVGRLIGTNIS